MNETKATNSSRYSLRLNTLIFELTSSNALTDLHYEPQLLGLDYAYPVLEPIECAQPQLFRYCIPFR